MKKEISIFVVIVIIIIFFAIVSRLAFLGIRPLHHDEGVNYFFADKIINGEGYRYDPTNYHGPLYFFLLVFSLIIFGISEFSLRLPAVLFGIILVALPLFWKGRNEFNHYVASFFLLISPSLLYYSRYSIHEISFVLFSLVAIYSFTRILEMGNIKYLPLFAVSLALLFTIKETAIIMLFIVFVIALININIIKKINFKEDYHLILLSIFLFLLIYILLFTSFFSNPQGLIDSIKGFMPWTSRGFEGAGHEKPFYYYILLLLRYEWPILLLALFGLYFAYRNKDVFSRNIAIWFLFSFIIYSLIPYKTPWLIINITAPMCLLAAIGINNIKLNGLKKNFKTLFFILILIGFAYLVYFSINLNFIKHWQEENKFAYVHTDKNILGLVDKVNELYKSDSAILMVSDEYWPLPFYFDGKNVTYSNYYNVTNDDLKLYNILIVRDKFFYESEFSSEYDFIDYRLREGVDLVLAWRER